ncbi:uncharacterized protein EDB93DRAFT_1118910 [Suillus bovinus]|uniref:uncharacterized protein n=1 Tax=Suillus bovinus TaxID=48563 RepID=UPI001B8768B7|nr:uncharacterized protein EDB93DRAFT_1118910 [Suillus bovinus]KAG2158558.1 hypothetical protein EDB93DRAFT_1118910 [Suillus bovinus]
MLPITHASSCNHSTQVHAHTAHSSSDRSSSPSTTDSSCGSGHPRLMSPIQNTENLFRTILNIRKGWKTLKGNSEPVWPPYLEAMMLKGLQEYKPVDSRETQILGRFPMRNRFISEYIYHKTGKHRSSKQIGSRLQQFRDTSEGRELIDSLTRSYLTTRTEVGSSRTFSTHNHVFEGESIHYLSLRTDSSSASASPTSSPAMPSSRRNNLPDNRTPVYIDILPDTNPSSSRSRTSYKGVTPSQPSSNTPRCMRDIDPTVTFVSPSTVIGKSSYIVLLDGAPIHSEDTKLECVGPYFTGAPGDGPLLYSTALVPKYWETLCKSPDPTVYTIIQDVYRSPDSTTSSRNSGRPRPVLIFSAVYHFRYSASARAPPPSIPQHLAYQPNPASLSYNTYPYPDMLNPTRPHPSHMSPGFADQGMFQSYDYGTQYRLDEPFRLDVNMDNFSLDDFMINIDSPEAISNDIMVQSSSSSFPKDIRNYIM